MARPRPLSGFPEFLPADQLVESRVVEIVTQTFSLHGFTPVETRAVEPLDQLNRKGEITKEVYVIRRLHAADDDVAELGLHFDLTVPFARYVLENAGQLVFPFRRYQIQKAWRGERPQEGRYREFKQADIDIVGQDSLAAHHDIEVVLVALEALERLHIELGLPPVLMRVNNRKLTEGFYDGLGVADPLAAVQIVDKLTKIGPDAVAEQLSGLGVSDEHARAILRLASIQGTDSRMIEQVLELGVDNELLRTGLQELVNLLDIVRASFPDRIIADLKIARGLDYYTGVVMETELVGHESIGAVSAGGRYDALASDGKTTFPGVGISLGISRILVPLLARKALSSSRPVPSCVVVAVDDEESRSKAVAVAQQLRSRGIPCEVAPKADKYGKQIRFAERRGVPFVWFGGADGEVKDIRSGEQIASSAASWTPPAEDLWPRIAPAAAQDRSR